MRAALDISLRPFPYPYRAALALCSDIDCCDRSTFLAVHRFLNDPQKGLGLPVADSFFALGREPGQLAYFLPNGQTPGPDAGLILRSLETGLIDCLHTWGDFNHIPPEPAHLRRTAATLVEHLQERHLAVKVWINHGSPTNLHNFLTRLRPEFQGDEPQSPFYTADLARRLGIAFFWRMELAPWPLSCCLGPFSPRLWARLGINAAKNLVKLLTRQRSRQRTAAQILQLCVPQDLRDGRRLMAFSRFNRHPQGLWARPGRHTLHHALTPGVLQQLLHEEGYLILYTHLGLPHPATVPLFPLPDRKALENLADKFHNGEIWVAPTAQLLTYWLTREGLVWETSSEGERLIINLVALHDPVAGPRLPQESDLAGVTFYSPRPQDTSIRLAGCDLDSRIFPPDHRGKGSLGLLPLPPPALQALEV
jgi:hypothetical protein